MTTPPAPTGPPMSSGGEPPTSYLAMPGGPPSGGHLAQSYRPMPAAQPDARYGYVQQPYGPPPGVPMRAQTRQFAFDGGAGTYVGTALLGFLVTICTLGFCYPFAVVLRERWRAKHSYIEGRQLAFIGSAWGLFGLWWKWLLLIFITIGIYAFWVGPRVYRWKWEHTSWAQQIRTGS